MSDARAARMMLLIAGLAMPLLAAAGCATVQLDPALYGVKRVAIASVYARTSIGFENVGAGPLIAVNDYGHEALEMELGETEGRLAEILGVEVLPVDKALLVRATAALPELDPADDWTRINEMIAVDLEAPTALPALGEVARALGVDGVVVLRHEWSLARDRFDVTSGVTAFDRCTIVVVDPRGRALWQDTVIARQPSLLLDNGTWGMGFSGSSWADEARQLARRTARQALDALARHHAEGRSAAAAPP